MAMDHEELRSRLAKVSLNDVDAVHALYVRSRDLLANRYHTSADLHDLTEVSRRADRAMGLAIRAAQARGEIRRHGQSRSKGKTPVTKYLGGKGESTLIYRMVDDVSDQVFEKALARCREAGILPSRPTLLRTFSEVTSDYEVVREVPVRTLRPTARGRRTVEHLAIQMNAIAMGVEDIDPGEVDKDAMKDVIFQAFEDIGTIRTFLRRVNSHE